MLFKLLDKSFVGLFTSDNLQFKNPEGNFFFPHMKWKMIVQDFCRKNKICSENMWNVFQSDRIEQVQKNKQK